VAEGLMRAMKSYSREPRAGSRKISPTAKNIVTWPQQLQRAS
jgi:hypothetical protein